MRKRLEPSAVMSIGEHEKTLRQFLQVVQEQGHAAGNLLGLLHVLIGRSITTVDGTLISSGLSWRDLAGLLRQVRWDRESVRELDVDPAELPPRDRQRFWFLAIKQACVDSHEAIEAGDQLAEAVQKDGYVIGPAPSN